MMETMILSVMTDCVVIGIILLERRDLKMRRINVYGGIFDYI
jgi:hypothetical protein